MNNEEKNPILENENEELNNVESSEEVAGDGAKKPSSSFLTLIITLVACVLVAVILIIALLPKNNEGTGENNEGTGESEGNDDGNDGGTSNDKTEYVITVVDQNGNAVKGVEITFYVEDGVTFPRTTDEGGNVYYTTAKSLQVAVTSLPNKYDYIKLNQKQTPANDGKLTLTVEREADEFFEVYVVDQYNNPVAGVKVQICADVCMGPYATDEEGKAYFKYDDTKEYHALISNLEDAIPEGYTVEDITDYYYFDGKVAVIRLTKVSN